jgi:hypothetical protein
VAADDAIPDHVRSFILAHVDSVVQLEILLLLHTRAQRQWTAAQVAAELRIDPAWSSNELARLAAAGLLATALPAAPAPPSAAADVAYGYAPRSAELDAAVQGLAREYALRRVTVIGLIFSKPVDKIRSFADAFRIRKDRDKDIGDG